MIIRVALIIVIALGFPPMVAAQHPSEVQQLAAQGDYYAAFTTYLRMPKRRVTPAMMVAAGRSAWSLGLPDVALDSFEQALNPQSGEKALSEIEQARVYLSKGIIEFQEGRNQVAIMYTEKASQLLSESGPLRAQVWLLWGEALSEMEKYSQAEAMYGRALQESAELDLGEVHYLLAACQERLGKWDEAKHNLESIPLNHQRSPDALKGLARVALERSDYENVLFWLDKGRELFPDLFADSFVDYTRAQAAIALDRPEQIRSIRESAAKLYAPSDAWMNLMDAAVEQYEWAKSHSTEVP